MLQRWECWVCSTRCPSPKPGTVNDCGAIGQVSKFLPQTCRTVSAAPNVSRRASPGAMHGEGVIRVPFPGSTTQERLAICPASLFLCNSQTEVAPQSAFASDYFTDAAFRSLRPQESAKPY